MFSVDDYEEWVYWEESREYDDDEDYEEEDEDNAGYAQCCGRCMKCLGLSNKDFY